MATGFKLIRLLLILCFVQVVEAQTSASSIRKIDFKRYLIERDHLRSNSLPCLGQPIQRIVVRYAKLLSDGSEQAIVEAVTCAMGNGGADIVEVFRLDRSGKPVALSIDDSLYAKNNLYEGQSWTPRLETINGKLTRWFIINDKGTNHSIKKGYKREIIYKWSGHSFVIEEVRDTPPVGHGE